MVWQGRRILVTGGTRGIGRAVVELALERGARCAVLSRSGPRAGDLADAEHVTADVTDHAALAAAVEEAAERLGGLDALVNNAGRVSDPDTPDGVLTTTPELMRDDFEEKVVGYLLALRAAHDHLARSGTGRVVNVGGAALRVARENVSSGARNSAVAHLTATAARTLGPSGVTVNAVHPGVVLTEGVHEALDRHARAAGTDPDRLRASLAARSAIGRLLAPCDVAEVVLFLASPASGGVTGQSLTVDGGSSSAVFH